MKRAEMTGVNKPLEIVTRDIPTPPEDGCIVRTTYAGVCHSDIHLLEDKFELGHGNAMMVSEVLKMRSIQNHYLVQCDNFKLYYLQFKYDIVYLCIYFMLLQI